MKSTLSVSMDQSSNLDAITNDQQIPIPACAGESMSTSISEHISTIGLDQKGRKFRLAESALVPGCTDGAALDNHLPKSAQSKHETEKTQNGQHKYKHKKEINLPFCASKHLAGIQVDPVPELKTSNRTLRLSSCNHPV